VSDRPYKLAWTLDEAVAEIVKSSGSVADPDVVSAFCRLVGQSRIVC